MGLCGGDSGARSCLLSQPRHFLPSRAPALGYNTGQPGFCPFLHFPLGLLCSAQTRRLPASPQCQSSEARPAREQPEESKTERGQSGFGASCHGTEVTTWRGNVGVSPPPGFPKCRPWPGNQCETGNRQECPPKCDCLALVQDAPEFCVFPK